MKKLLLILAVALAMAFALDVPNNAFGQTRSQQAVPQKKVIPTIGKDKVLFEGKVVKELILADGSKLDAKAIKNGIKGLKIDGSLLKFNGQTVNSFVLNGGGLSKIVEECSCYPPIPPPPPPPFKVKQINSAVKK